MNGDRLEAVIAWLAMPAALKRGDDSLPDDLPALAKRLGVGVREIERWKKDPRVYKTVTQNLRLTALYLLPDAIWAQGQLALEKKDTKALRALAQIAGVLSEGQAKVEIHNTNVSNSSLEISMLPDSELFKRAATIWSKAKDAAVATEPTINEGGD